METRSLKALSILRLRGNLQKNSKETLGVQKETGEETVKSFPVSLCRDGNQETTYGNPSQNQEVSDWCPEPKVWLENNELRTRGISPGEWPNEGLTPDIVKLTTDNLPLQAKLLKLHVGRYFGPNWKALVEQWEERAAIMEYDGGMSRQDAEMEAAKLYRMLAFLPELRKEQPISHGSLNLTHSS